MDCHVTLLLAGALMIVKSKEKFANGTKILNVISLVLLAFVAVNIGMFHIGSNDSDNAYSSADPSGKSSDNNKQRAYPDIYFIILDAYAREDILREIYNFDNSEFLDFMEDSGFYVAAKSISNYGQTGLSLGAAGDGAVLALVAKKVFVATTEATGILDLDWLDTGTEAAYLGVKLPNGNYAMSAALTNA